MKKTKPKVQLIRYTGAPCELIASAARLCYAEDTETIFDQDSGQAEKFVGMLRNMGYMSPIEHVVFSLTYSGKSVILKIDFRCL